LEVFENGYNGRVLAIRPLRFLGEGGPK